METKEQFKQKIRANMEERYNLLYKARINTKLQALIKEKCKRDIIYFFNYFVYTEKNNNFFERDGITNSPFLPFEYQQEFLQDAHFCIENRTNIFIEKSRQMGITWMLTWLTLYEWLFHNRKSLIVSRTADEVDKKGDINSFFERLRYMIRMLPQWLLPNWFSKNDGTDYNKYMLVTNPENNASIAWESASSNAWRWWTYDFAFLDEMAFMPDWEAINRSISSASPCRIYNSTPNWEWNEYFRMRELAMKEIELIWNWKLTQDKARFHFFRLHWSEHPFYDQEWYERECRSSTPERIAQELDINYNVAIKWRVYPNFKSPEVLFWTYEYDYRLPLYISIDNSHWWSDPNAIIVCQKELDTHFIRIIDCLEINCTITQIASLFGRNPQQGFIMDDTTQDFYNRYLNYKQATFIADPYDSDATWNDSSIRKEYIKYWIHLNLPTKQKWLYWNIIEQIRLTTINLNRLKISNKCKSFISALQNARFPENKTRTEPVKKPIHDWTSHFRTSLEYLMLYILENEIIKTKTKQKIEVSNPITWEITIKYI